MKIKSKLFLLISTLMTAVFFSIIIFIAMQLIINNFEKEKTHIEELDKAMENELFEISTFFFPDVQVKPDFNFSIIEYGGSLYS